MRIYHGIDGYEAGGRLSVALGFFDGVHEGHREVIRRCTEQGTRVAVLTFEQSPASVLGGEAPPALTDNERKAELIAQLGVDELIFADFSAVRDLSAEAFVKTILREKLGAEAVSCGYNYRFGKNGSGDTQALRRLCELEGIRTYIAEPVDIGGRAVSSTAIRKMLSGGDIEGANKMLGWRYSVSGAVGGGNRVGRTLGFPTVNLPIGEGMCVPRYGVYASRLIIDGKEYRGATNIGVHPTVMEAQRPVCETFILDYEGEGLYGEQAVCELTAFIRPERRFDSPEELTAQIEKDVNEIILRQHRTIRGVRLA